MTSRAGKYARFEFERRFLANRVPSGLRTDTGWRIYDRYIKNTHLRLRRQEPLGGGETIYKLGQKNAPSPPDFARTTMTTLYLSRGGRGEGRARRPPAADAAVLHDRALLGDRDRP